MEISYIINFKDSLPSIYEIVEQVKLHTGLDIQVDYKSYIIEHPLFKDKKFVVDINENLRCVELGTGIDGMWYLLGATIAVLLKMGGTYKSEVYPWAWKKWDQMDENDHSQIETSGFKIKLEEHYSIYFEGEPPTKEVFLNEVKLLTKLNIRLVHVSLDTYTIECEEFAEPAFFISFEPHYHRILITPAKEEICYLKSVSLLALKNLGGRFDLELPPWSKKNYQDLLKSELEELTCRNCILDIYKPTEDELKEIEFLKAFAECIVLFMIENKGHIDLMFKIYKDSLSNFDSNYLRNWQNYVNEISNYITKHYKEDVKELNRHLYSIYQKTLYTYYKR